MIIFFAIITGAHFFLYGWFYRTKVYLIMSPMISIIITAISWNLKDHHIWYVPLSMIVLLIIQIGWLYIDYRQKINMSHSKSVKFNY